MATNICPVHRSTFKDGEQCVWCSMGSRPLPASWNGAPNSMWNNFDGRDDKVRQHYDAKTGLQAKPTKQDDQVAEYERPWARPWFQTYMDHQPAPSPHTLETHRYWEWGDMQVRGDAASAARPDVIGWVTLGADANGEPTLAIRDSRI